MEPTDVASPEVMQPSSYRNCCSSLCGERREATLSLDFMPNRTAFVTGASRGIGRACALALAGTGTRVVCAARDAAKLEEVAGEIQTAGGESFVVSLDLSSAESIKEAFARASKEFGRIDILVNNAGITKDGLAMRMKRDDWDSVLTTNLTGAFLCIQQVMPAMMKERWGRIINISSGRRRDRQSGPGELRRVEGGTDRIDQVACPGDRQPEHHGERGRAGIHRYRHDRRARGRGQECMLSRIPLKRFGQAGGCRRGRAFPGERRGGLHHRPRSRRERRNVYVISSA